MCGSNWFNRGFINQATFPLASRDASGSYTKRRVFINTRVGQKVIAKENKGLFQAGSLSLR